MVLDFEHNPPPYVTALGLGRYINSRPLSKAAVVDRLRRQQESTGGFNPYSKIVKAMRLDLRFGVGDNMAEAVRDAPVHFESHYREFGRGWAQFMETLEDHAAHGHEKVRNTMVVRRGLTINLNPHFGIRRPGGDVQAVYLWFDQLEPQEETRLALLFSMESRMEDIYPGGSAVLIDVRRGQAHTLPARTRARLIDRFIDSQAAAIVANWTAVAA
jgi:hypothetical protein